jgi:hypothetical protein
MGKGALRRSINYAYECHATPGQPCDLCGAPRRPSLLVRILEAPKPDLPDDERRIVARICLACARDPGNQEWIQSKRQGE